MPQNAAPNGGGRDAAALALAAGSSQTEAAQAAGCDRSTVARWLSNDPTFRRQVADLRRDSFETAVGVLIAEAEAAARQLVELAVGAHSNGPVRLGSIRTLFQIAADHFTVADLEERVASLEAALQREEGAA